MTVRRQLALIGDERARTSPSPAMHDAIFGSGTYGLLLGEHADLLFERAEATMHGVNVTAPHKRAAFGRYASVVDAAAARCGAVNTIVYDDNGRATVATNTDVAGVREAWRRAAVALVGRAIAIVGAGGAARAVVVAAKDAGAERVIVHARDRGRGAGLVAHAATVGLDAALADGGESAAVVVLAASALEDVASWIARAARPAAVVHDLRYGARARASRDAALRGGHLFLDGTSMLLAQALEAARLFAGADLTDGQRAAARAALARAG